MSIMCDVYKGDCERCKSCEKKFEEKIDKEKFEQIKKELGLK